jgi:hypothetical protein
MNNIITQNVISGTVLLRGNVNGPANDQVTNNTFIGAGSVQLQVAQSGGTIIASNQFSATETSAAIQVDDSGTLAAPTTIANNAITGRGIGMEVSANQVLVPTSTRMTAVRITNNAIQTTGQNGFGLVVSMSPPGGTVLALVQGNDFHGNAIGVLVVGDGSGTTQLDLGLGSLGSLGGNDFRGFAAPASNTNAAIELMNSTANLMAEGNLFRPGINPNSVVNAVTPGGVVDVGNALSPGQALVQALYNEVLGRTGQLAELDPWVGLLNSQGQQAVVNGILRSNEALGRIVDALYLRFLGRASDPSGRAGWIGFLQSGNTEEQLETLFLTSPEYISHINTDYVQSLYINILGRTGSGPELAGWYSSIQSLGLSGIANGFVTSPENRLNTVRGYFQTFLHRTPTNDELASIIVQRLDLLSLEGLVLSSSEYFLNG